MLSRKDNIKENETEEIHVYNGTLLSTQPCYKQLKHIIYMYIYIYIKRLYIDIYIYIYINIFRDKKIIRSHYAYRNWQK